MQTARRSAAVFFCFATILLMSTLALAGNTSAPNSAPCSPMATTRITAPVDERMLATLHGNVHPLALAEYDQGRVDDNLPLEHIILMLQRSPEQEAALNTRIDQMHNRRSPNYHQWLRAEDVGACYGPANTDLATVTGWLQMHGFKIDTVPAGKTMVIFTGTAGQVRNAFHTEIHNLYVNGERHIANMSEPQIPKALAPVVAGFRSLHNFFPKPLSHIVGPIKRDPKTGAYHPAELDAGRERASEDSNGPGRLLTIGIQGNNGTTTYYAVGPQDFYTIYNENALLKASTPINGAGQTIAIVQDSDVNPADVATFRAEFGLPAYPVTPNATQGGVNYMDGITAGNYCDDPGIVNGGESEADIDVQWAGATAPAAIIDFVSCKDTTTTSGVDLSAQYIVSSMASTVSAFSVSFGWCEAQLPDTQIGFGSNSFYSTLWQQAAAEGQTAIVAAGDSGDDVCDRGNGKGPNNQSVGTTGVSVSGLASTPYNVAAGGTDFSDTYQTNFSPTAYWTTNDTEPFESALSYVPETAWNNTCADPLLADYFRYTGQGTYTPEQVCNVSTNWTNLDGGSGGISTISALPTWQSVYGVGLSTNFTSTSMRNLPDIAMFASDGSIWDHLLVFCQSDQATCDYTNGTDVIHMAAGGTSFVAPMFNGIMALINQATSTSATVARQGQADYTLYALANAEYGTASSQNTSTTAPSTYTCEASNVNALSTYKTIFPSCTFYEVNRTSQEGSTTCLAGTNTACLTDNNAQPCETGSPNCYTATQSDTYGILSSSTTTSEPAYVQSFGYNAATGLGSFNIANLVNNWTTVTPKFPSTTAASASPASIFTSTTTTLTATVTATGRGSLAPPLGTVTFYPGSACTGTALGTANLVPATGCTTKCNSTATLANVAGSAIGTSTTSIAACFGGDAANDAPSNGTGTIAVTQTAFTLAAQSSTVTITAGQSGTVQLNLSANASVAASGITLKCAGLPADASCTFSALSGTIGTTATPVTMTIQTTTSDAKLLRPGSKTSLMFALIMPAMLLLPVAAGSRKRKGWLLLLTAIALILMLSWTGCGGGSSSSGSGGGTTSQTYSVTATASATGVTAGTTGTITVTVSQ